MALGRFGTRWFRNAGSGADKIGYPRFHPMLLLGRALTACSTCLELPSRCCLCFAADLRYAAAPSETFGLAGIFMDRRHSLAALLCFLRLTFIMGCFQCTTPSALLANVGNSASGRTVRPGVAQSSLEPEKFPRQRLSGRNHDRHRRRSELSKSTTPPSVFSTLWSGIDLPALLVLVRGRMIL